MTFDVAVDFDREPRWKRPLVKPPGGGGKIAYTRCTTYVDALDSKYALSQWQQRMVAVGMSQRQDLLLGIASIAPQLMLPTDEVPKDAKARANEYCEAAIEAARGTAAATTGTALHMMTQHHDLGHPLGVIPDSARADIASYAKATSVLTALHVEQPMVHDGLLVGGTPDRIVDFGGRTYIADVKTGSIDFAAMKIAMQLAVYAHSTIYDPTTDKRVTTPDIDKRRAIVIHLPAGKASCSLIWVDIDRGWRAVQTAKTVHALRKIKDWLTPIDVDVPLFDEATPNISGGDEAAQEAQQRLAAAIAACTSTRDLTDLWARNRDVWDDSLTGLASERKQQIEGAVA